MNTRDNRTERLAPGMAEAMARDDELQGHLPADAPLALRRERGIAAAGWWAQGSPDLKVTNHKYAGADGEGGTLRIFRGRHPAPAPVVLYIHGGGWVQGSIDQNEPVIRRLAARSGWSVAAISYRLAPEHPFPAALEDCVAALDWLARKAGPLGLDADRLVLSGASAGGNLALSAALAADRRLAGLLLFYGVFGDDFDTPTYRAFGDGRYGLARAGMMQYFDLYDPAGRRDRDPLITPLRADLTGLPPACLVAAELDVLRADSERLHRRLTAAGVAATLQTVAGVTHGFINRGRLVPAADAAIDDAAGFLSSL